MISGGSGNRAKNHAGTRPDDSACPGMTHGTTNHRTRRSSNDGTTEDIGLGAEIYWTVFHFPGAALFTDQCTEQQPGTGSYCRPSTCMVSAIITDDSAENPTHDRSSE
jgi:hypothetical protein